jgi:HTH-type transcriptional regulator/antitoxin HigA
MLKKIENEAQYRQVITSIEEFTLKATNLGGFDFLLASEKDELGELSLLAEQYEDDVLKIMPL